MLDELLLRVVATLPELHRDTIVGVGASVEAVVGAAQLELVADPSKVLGAVARAGSDHDGGAIVRGVRTGGEQALVVAKDDAEGVARWRRGAGGRGAAGSGRDGGGRCRRVVVNVPD